MKNTVFSRIVKRWIISKKGKGNSRKRSASARKIKEGILKKVLLSYKIVEFIAKTEIDINVDF